MNLSWRVLSLSILLIQGCANAPLYPELPLVDQILKPRTGYQGLTHSVCQEYDGEKCVKMEIKEYKLDEYSVRKSFNDLQFICNIAGKRWKICLDRPGFCRFTYKRKWFLGKKHRIEEYQGIKESYEFLVNAKAKCFNKDKYPFGGVN